jgi:hypothetical protein
MRLIDTAGTAPAATMSKHQTGMHPQVTLAMRSTTRQATCMLSYLLTHAHTHSILSPPPPPTPTGLEPGTIYYYRVAEALEDHDGGYESNRNPKGHHCMPVIYDRHACM